MEERQCIAEIVVRVAKGRVPVLVQAGAASTNATVALTRHAQKIGASAATVVTPWYFRYSGYAKDPRRTRPMRYRNDRHSSNNAGYARE